MFSRNSMRLFNFPMGRLCQRSSSTALIAISISVIFYTFGISKTIATEDTYFKVPSGNIHCRANTDGSFECEIQKNLAKLSPKPKDCDLDWGNRFGMSSATGKAQRVCHGDTLGLNPKNPVLNYGKTWNGQGFFCISRRSGLTCQNDAGHGWILSKNKQQLF
jgi:hypothetical protein